MKEISNSNQYQEDGIESLEDLSRSDDIPVNETHTLMNSESREKCQVKLDKTEKGTGKGFNKYFIVKNNFSMTGW